MSIFKHVIKFFANIRLAIFIILSMAAIAAVGTIVEARYDSEVAQKLVYRSPYMYFVMGLLIITLISVMIDRWPWKRHHTGFVMAHVGIIVLLLGAFITQKFGVDGSMAFTIGQQNRYITVKNEQLTIYSSFTGSDMREMYSSPVDFIRHPPSEKKPFIVHLGQDEMRFVHYDHFAFRDEQVMKSDLEHDGPAVRFQLENSRVNLIQWVRGQGGSKSGSADLGPAEVVLTDGHPVPDGRNEVVLIAHGRSPVLDYVVFNKDKSVRKRGQIRETEMIETGWMGLKFHLLRYLEHGRDVVTYTPSDVPSPIANPAVKFTFRGKTYWLGLDSVLELFLNDRAYWVSYGHRQVELNFPLTLKKFTVGHYQGTERPSSYQSVVHVPTRGDVTIAMNRPLKFQGFTFYQSSFDKNELGQPTTSILSVNYDPGRWIKYLGSILLVLGCIVLFYFKRARWPTKRGKK